MMINKRLIGTVRENKKYVAGNVALQWCSLLANIAMMTAITVFLGKLFANGADSQTILTTLLIAAVCVAVRYCSATWAARMGYLSSKAVKKTLREKIYEKILRLGASYSEQVQTSEIVQVAVEGVDQLETYFGAYLPQFFYAVLVPLTLFVTLGFVNLPAAVVLLICVPLIPVAIAAVQTWAKKLLSKYWDQYTALGVIVAVTQYAGGRVSLAGCLLIILLSADFFIPMHQLGSFFHIAMNGMAASDKIFRLLDLQEAEQAAGESVPRDCTIVCSVVP